MRIDAKKTNLKRSLKPRPQSIMATSTTECDTLPAPRFASPDRDHSHSPSPSASPPSTTADPVFMSPPPTTQRKLCVRHQRMADEDTNLKLQQVCCFRSNPVLPGADISYSLSMLSPYRNEKPSMQSGLASHRRRTQGENSSSRAFSPCAVSLSFPCSQNSSAS